MIIEARLILAERSVLVHCIGQQEEPFLAMGEKRRASGFRLLLAGWSFL
jgi:hypothetical protein